MSDKSDKKEQQSQLDWDNILLVTIVILLLLTIFYTIKEQYTVSKENLEDMFYLDQIAMKHSDPTYMKYAGRDKDILGQSHRDYYLENRMYSNSRAADQKLDDSAYYDQTDYLQMPAEFRPTLESVPSMEPFVGANNY